MILIWDNGESYSDHSIYFVDMGNISKEQAEERVEWIIKNLNDYHRDAEPVAIMETIVSWRGGFILWDEFVDRWVDMTKAHDFECEKYKAAYNMNYQSNFKMSYEEYKKAICNCGITKKIC